MKLIIAEKPSVAAAYAAALDVRERKDGYIEGGGYLISWCIGHLVGLSEAAAYGEQYRKWSYDTLPILPEKWQYTVSQDKGKQFKTLKELMHRTDVSEVVNACDAGREGELIFRFVYEMAGCTRPMKRLWLSSMEEDAIRTGFSSLKDGADYEALYASALCRAKADWLVGINATRLFSCLYHHTLNVGRVQTPTLKMLVDRDAAITGFQKEPYYHVCLALDGAEAVSERIREKEKAEGLKTACERSQTVCTTVTREKKTLAPPKLFDLTLLQREANRIYGYTAKQTLDLAQALYEKRLLTYPRTDSNFLTDDMEGTAADIIELVGVKLPFMSGAVFTPEISRLLDSKRVSDHHAIIPTMALAKADPGALSESERNILYLVGARLLMAAAEPHVYEAVTAVFSCAGAEFTAKGRAVLAEGWKGIEKRFRTSLKKVPDAEDDEAVLELPSFTEGQSFDAPPVRVTEHETKPPKPHTEDTLLSAMERAGNEETDEDAERRGLGTPATRAAIIEKLVASGFVQRKGRQLIPTKNGYNLIARGKADPDAFLSGIETMTRELIKAHPFLTGDEAKRFQEERKAVGRCPRCGEDVFEGRKNYYCADKDCAFVMWKDDRFFSDRRVTFSEKIAADLLKSGRAKVKKIYSPKTGKTYDGTVLLADTGGKYVNYKVAIERDRELS